MIGVHHEEQLEQEAYDESGQEAFEEEYSEQQGEHQEEQENDETASNKVDESMEQEEAVVTHHHVCWFPLLNKIFSFLSYSLFLYLYPFFWRSYFSVFFSISMSLYS